MLRPLAASAVLAFELMCSLSEEQRAGAVFADCVGSIYSLVELLQGRLSKAVMERICTPMTGLFPAPKEIQFSCSCPDWAAMCKHIAAVLYGVGARLDQQPELIFTLRGVNAQDLVTQAGTGLPTSKRRPATGKVLDDAMLADVFGIEMATVAPLEKPAAPHRMAKTGKTPIAKSPKPVGKKKAKTATAQAPAPKSAGLGKLTAGKVTTAKAKSGRVKTIGNNTAAGAKGDTG